MRGSNLALKNLSLSIETNQSLAILGPNGSGKTSLLKLIAREIYPLDSNGSHLKILGAEHFDIRDYRRQLGVVSSELQQKYERETPGLEVVISGFFDSNSLWQHFKIEPNQVEMARQIMAELGIADLEDRPFGNLSTGQQARLLLARAMVHRPNTLILDEPTAGLDYQASFQYLELMRSLFREGTSIIVVTHHVHEIPPEIDRIVLLQKGQLFADGKKKDIMTTENLSQLFGTPMQLTETQGYFQALPAGRD